MKYTTWTTVFLNAVFVAVVLLFGWKAFVAFLLGSLFGILVLSSYVLINARDLTGASKP